MSAGLQGHMYMCMSLYMYEQMCKYALLITVPMTFPPPRYFQNVSKIHLKK